MRRHYSNVVPYHSFGCQRANGKSHAGDEEKLSYLSHENNPIRNEQEETIRRGWLKSHPDRSYRCVTCLKKTVCKNLGWNL